MNGRHCHADDFYRLSVHGQVLYALLYAVPTKFSGTCSGGSEPSKFGSLPVAT